MTINLNRRASGRVSKDITRHDLVRSSLRGAILTNRMKKSQTLAMASLVSIGSIFIISGIWGSCFTYQNIARENIVTTPDSAIPEQPVRGPLTLKAQADVIRKHTLGATNNQTFAQMPREIEKKDEQGKTILNAEGKPVMVENQARNMWVTATTLTSALHLALLAYAFSAFTIVTGCMLVLSGYLFYSFSKK